MVVKTGMEVVVMVVTGMVGEVGEDGKVWDLCLPW